MKNKSLVTLFLTFISVVYLSSPAKSKPIRLLYDETDCFEGVCCKNDGWSDITQDSRKERYYVVEVYPNTFVYVGGDSSNSGTNGHYQIGRYFSTESIGYSPKTKEDVKIRVVPLSPTGNINICLSPNPMQFK